AGDRGALRAVAGRAAGARCGGARRRAARRRGAALGPAAPAAHTCGMNPPDTSTGPPAGERITRRIAELSDWRGRTLERMRGLILQADPQAVEEWKWGGTPVWSHDGILCTGETYKSVVKLTFAKGASLPDPAGLFNASLDG